MTWPFLCVPAILYVLEMRAGAEIRGREVFPHQGFTEPLEGEDIRDCVLNCMYPQHHNAPSTVAAQ